MELYPHVGLETLVLDGWYLCPGDDCVSDVLGLALPERLGQHQAQRVVEYLNCEQDYRGCLVIPSDLIQLLEQPGEGGYFGLVLLVQLPQVAHHVLADLPRPLRRVVALEVDSYLVEGDVLDLEVRLLLVVVSELL